MKQLKLVLLLLIGALAIAGFAYSSEGPNAQLVNQDRLYGGGGTDPGCFVPDIGFCRTSPTNFAIDAHATGTSQAAYGDLVGGGSAKQITCLAVDGHNAVVGGIITAAPAAPNTVGELFAQFFTDNGTVAFGGDAVSPLYVGPADPTQWPPGFPNRCPSPDTGAPDLGLFPSFLPIVRGDIVIQDGGLATSDATHVVVPRGQAIQITLAYNLTGFASSLSTGIANAVQMAVDAHPTIRGFPIHVNLVDAPCGDPPADVAAAHNIAANLQNVGVLGQLCSGGFDQSLPVYESAGLVTITGSATSDALPAFGPTVFDRTVVDDDTLFDPWYATVTHLPSDVAWQQAYTSRFGTAPTTFADLYFDAAGLLIRNLDSVATIDRGNLVIDRAALAHAVRGTTDYPGVTCTITLDPATGNRVNDPAALARCGG